MNIFDDIRPFFDTEVNQALHKINNHPMMMALMKFTFPDVPKQIWSNQLKNTFTINDFQSNFISKSIQNIIEKTSAGLTVSGFEKLDKNTAYLYISNHRDILLDTSLLNYCLLKNNLIMTASAIGDNLVKNKFIHTLAKLNRNFLVKRGLSPREMLESSKIMSAYIKQLLLQDNRSVWIAQREGRTKDGNDSTQSGVLKMLSMADSQNSSINYFKTLKIVPVSISYEYDPTDGLKMPQILAKANNQEYIKADNEDFNTILSGIMGQKKHIHIHVCDVLNTELDQIQQEFDNKNNQVQALAHVIDKAILKAYKLWTTNYIAYDILFKTNKFETQYTDTDKQLFIRRMEMKISNTNEVATESFLKMYANPVVNKLK